MAGVGGGGRVSAALWELKLLGCTLAVSVPKPSPLGQTLRLPEESLVNQREL